MTRLVPISAKLDYELVVALKKYATRNKMSVSEVVRRAIMQYIQYDENNNIESPIVLRKSYKYICDICGIKKETYMSMWRHLRYKHGLKGKLSKYYTRV